MSVFVELTTDAFDDVFNEISSKSKQSRRAGLSRARRPVRGLEIKDDTFAQIRVIKADGSEIELLDAGSPTGRTNGYTNFILQAVTEARMEKHQIVETFGEDYIFFFGEQPRFLDCQAVLVNSHDFNWEAEFWANYDQYMRGTKCAEIGARVYLFYDDCIVDGYMVMAQANKNASQPMEVAMQFRLFLTGYQNISLIGDPNFPAREGIDPSLIESSGTNERVPPGLTSSGFIQGQTLYGKFSDAADEYIGSQFPEDDQDPEEIDTSGIGGDHPDALTRAATDAASDGGADIDDAKTQKGLGLLDEDKAKNSGSFGMMPASGAVV